MGVIQSAYRRKQRNTEDRKRRPIVFLIAEGKNKTETLYFKAFGHDVNRNVRFAPGDYTDPVNMVSTLKSFMADNDFSPELGDKAYSCTKCRFANNLKRIEIFRYGHSFFRNFFDTNIESVVYASLLQRLCKQQKADFWYLSNIFFKQSGFLGQYQCTAIVCKKQRIEKGALDRIVCLGFLL